MKQEPLQILVVDDEPNMRKVIRAMLIEDGFEVHDARDGESALAVLADHHIDIVVTDLKMPKIDGMTFIKMVREKNASIPIIIITGYGSAKNRALAKSYGVNKILSKPCSIADITQSINSTLN